MRCGIAACSCERASKLVAESLDLYRAVESKFDIAGSLAQQGFLAQRQGETAFLEQTVTGARMTRAQEIEFAIGK